MCGYCSALLNLVLFKAYNFIFIRIREMFARFARKSSGITNFQLALVYYISESLHFDWKKIVAANQLIFDKSWNNVIAKKSGLQYFEMDWYSLNNVTNGFENHEPYCNLKLRKPSLYEKKPIRISSYSVVFSLFYT